MDLSIIIVSFNTRTLLSNCLTAVYNTLAKSSFTFEVIVIDNGSTDGSRVLVQKKFPKAIVVANQENVGFGRANNQGIKKAQGEHILLLNSDTVPEPDAIPKLLAFSREHKDVFVGPKLLNPDGSPQTSGGPFFTLPVAFAILFLFGDRTGLTRVSPNRTMYIDWVSGACIIAPAKLFRDGLLFDEGVFMYMEEIDLLMRARAKGYRTMFYPDARVMHIGSGSSTDKRKGPILNIYRGFLYLYKKHYNRSLGALKFMLRVKAAVAMFIGRVTKNSELRQTYEEAYRMV